MLSQRHLIFSPDHRGPQRATATTIGTNSFGLMWMSFHPSGQDNWNHLPSQTAPQPHEPDASEIIVAAELDGDIRLTPFQTERNVFHQATSALASALRDTWWSSAVTVVDALIRFLINARPGCTTLEAWWSRPIKDSNSLLTLS